MCSCADSRPSLQLPDFGPPIAFTQLNNIRLQSSRSDHSLHLWAEKGRLQQERANSMSTAAQKLGTQTNESPPPGAAQQNNNLLESMPWLPCTLTVDLPVPRFTIGDLLALTEGSIVETACHHTSDLPLRVNKLLIGWTEFNVVGERLAVRITEQV